MLSIQSLLYDVYGALPFKVTVALFLVLTNCHPASTLEPRIGKELHPKEWINAPIIVVGKIKAVDIGWVPKIRSVEEHYAHLILEELEIEIENILKGNPDKSKPIIAYRWGRLSGLIEKNRVYNFFSKDRNDKFTFIQDRRVFYLLPFKNHYRFFSDYGEGSRRILSGKPIEIRGDSVEEKIIHTLLYPGSGYEDTQYFESIKEALAITTYTVGTSKKIQIFEEFMNSEVPDLYKAAACVSFLRFPEIISHPCLNQYVSENTHPYIQEELNELRHPMENHAQQFSRSPLHWLFMRFALEEGTETKFDYPERTVRVIIERNLQWTQDPSIKKQLRLFLTDLEGYREKAFSKQSRLNEARNQKTHSESPPRPQ